METVISEARSLGKYYGRHAVSIFVLYIFYPCLGDGDHCVLTWLQSSCRCPFSIGLTDINALNLILVGVQY